MSNTYQRLTPEEFKAARRGEDGSNSPHRFLIHEFPVEDETRPGRYRISVSHVLDQTVLGIDRELIFHPTCLVPVDEQRRHGVEFCIQELQKAQANKRGIQLRPDLLAIIDNLPEFDPGLSARYEVWVPRC